MGKVIIAIALISMTIACASGNSHEKKTTRLMANIPTQSLNFQDKWIIKSGNYTADGQEKLIAFICTDSPSEEGATETYYLYYCDDEKISVCDTICGWFYQTPEVHNVNNVYLLTYTIGFGGPSGESFCWKCTNSQLIPIRIPGELTIIGDNYFRCQASGFDGLLPDGENYTIGRCWYTYYYYFDGNDFKEYTGRSITENEFISITGYKNFLASIRENGFTIRNILYRDNGIIDINCSIRQEGQNYGWMSTQGGTAFYYLRLIYLNGSWRVEDDWQEGNIKPMHSPVV